MNVKNILVPTDFSPSSEAALSRACTVARSFEAQLHLVHVVSGEFDGDASRRTLEKLGRAIEPHFELNLDVRKESLAGVAYKQITDYARKHDVDLIVMGTQGRTGLDHLVMGSAQRWR